MKPKQLKFLIVSVVIVLALGYLGYSGFRESMLDAAIANGKTVILTTHDLEQGLRAATRAVIIDRGKLAFSSDARDPSVRDAYAQYVRFGVGA